MNIITLIRFRIIGSESLIAFYLSHACIWLKNIQKDVWEVHVKTTQKYPDIII